MSAEPVAVTSWSVLGQYARVRFDVVAEQQPGLLPRLLAPFARRDLAPDSFHADMVHADRHGTGMVRVQIGVDAIPADQLSGIEGNLRQTFGVRTVLVQRELTGVFRRAG